MFSNGSSWLKRLVGGTRRPCKSKPRTQLNVEILEDRSMPSVTLLGGITGINNTGWEPPDTGVAVGANYAIETANSSLAIYNKSTGSLVSQETLASLFSGFYSGAEGQFDPQVLYDDIANRFVIAAPTSSTTDGGSASAYTATIDFAISNSSDPTQGWTTQQIEVDQGGTNWVDNGKLGYNADAWVYSGNRYGNASGSLVLSIDKSSIGNGTWTSYLNDISGFSTVPARMHGAVSGGPMWFVETNNNGGNSVRLLEMNNVLSTNPTFTATDLATDSYSPSSMTQPGGTLSFDSRTESVEWNNNNLVAAWNSMVGSDAAAFWTEFNTGGASPTLTQEGVINPGTGVSTYMPAIAVDAAGDIGLTYIQSSSNQYPSTYITGHQASDPLNTMEGGVEVEAGNASLGGGRVGDYAGMSLDPSSSNTFWAANEYGLSGVANNWGTAIAPFQFSSSGLLAPPTNVVATAGNAQVSLSWTASSGATSYDIYRGTASGGETLLQTGVTGTQFTDTGLNNGTSYYYVVTAVNAAGQSGDSNESSATPGGGGTLTGNAAFVEALYQDFLHRSGDTTNPSDAGYWVNALNTGSITPAQLANVIARSQEALTYQVDALYQNILGRQADPGGQGYFVNMLVNGGAIEQVMFDMLTSGEFAADTGSDAAFIQSLYSKVLARTASNPEVQGWLSALPYLGRTGVVYDFLTSAEFRGDAVTQLYDGAFSQGSSISSLLPNLLQRTPSSAEVGGWVHSGLSLLTIEVAFAGSNEFYNDNAAVNQNISYVPNEPSAGGTYAPVQGTLFGPNGPSYLDVAQGVIGDCWLLSSLAETAVRAPSDITSMFTYDGTAQVNGATVGVYGVRFYDSNGTAHVVTVDTELPAGGGMYDRPVNGVLWVALAEKAYAEANGAGLVTTQNVGSDSYAALDEGQPAWALQAITGKPASYYSINPSDVAAAWNAGELVVIATPNTTPAAGLVQNHAYAVVGYDNNTQTFTVFNPWGTDSAGWVPGKENQIYGLFNASGNYLYQNFVEESFGSGAANGTGLTGWQEMVGQFFLTDQQHHHRS